MPTDESIIATLDVRALAPRDRHVRIFQQFMSFPRGQALLLINDHDPKPLYYQFLAEHPGEVEWLYVQQGPEVWQVRIGKLAK
ncbi:MAG: DUF2249 domain-containing protein [Chloroflexi bacterium]|nr:DUF2249 domain-containing protein [Chloroflexota bacterium]